MTDLPQTEHVNPRTAGLDELSTEDLVHVLVDEQGDAIDAVMNMRETVARVVDEIAQRMRAGGRLHYVGAGTSGRLGFLDASEMPPTFGTDSTVVCAHIAGGLNALTQAVEGAEDDCNAGAREMRAHVQRGDAVLGLSASGGAPYVLGAIAAAREIGAVTIGVANSPDTPLLRESDIPIFLDTGPEPLTGSTRMKAGTSQKLLLNTISTAIMVRLGKVHDNLMVDVVATNSKLRNRALRLVALLTQENEDRARSLLDAAGGNVKVAVVMAKRGIDADRARETLQSNEGSLRRSI